MPQDIKIRLDNSRLRSIIFKIKEEERKDKVMLDNEICYSYDYNYREKRITSLISISIDKGQAPFFLNIEYEGTFILNKRVAKKRIQPFAEINCPAILFPFLREFIADITRRGGLNPLLLPTINFVELAKQQKNKKKL